MPLTATYALAMAGTPAISHDMSMMDAKGEMPCHKPMKPCSNCPQKVCPEMGSCLVKCFQPLPVPVSEARLHGDVIGERIAPMPHEAVPDFIATPTRLIHLPDRARRPNSLNWPAIDPDELEQIPALIELQRARGLRG